MKVSARDDAVATAEPSICGSAAESPRTVVTLPNESGADAWVPCRDPGDESGVVTLLAGRPAGATAGATRLPACVSGPAVGEVSRALEATVSVAGAADFVIGRVTGAIDFVTGRVTGATASVTCLVTGATALATGATTGATGRVTVRVTGATICATGATIGASVRVTVCATGATICATGATTGATVRVTVCATGATICATGASV